MLLLGWDAGEQVLVGYAFNSVGDNLDNAMDDVLKGQVGKGTPEASTKESKWSSPCKLAFGQNSNRYEDVTDG